MKPLFEGKRILITGGTGSLGKMLAKRLLRGDEGMPERVVIFSRDEAKQHFMRLEFQHRTAATDEVIFRNFEQRLQFRIGDVRDYSSIAAAVKDSDIVFNAAALKQVPSCEYFPWEAVRTNIEGPNNIVRAVEEMRLEVETVVGVSTDKACKPVNVMGMTKALQERVFTQANLRCPRTRFICARYGNVLASRGSVVPLFLEQIRSGGPVTITTSEMTRFLLSLEEAVDTIFAAVRSALPGETYVPRVPSALILHVAKAMIGDRDIRVAITGIRPGEKVHESLISEEEAIRTVSRDRCFAILPMLPELRGDTQGDASLTTEFSSADCIMSFEETRALLRERKLMPDDQPEFAGELLA